MFQTVCVCQLCREHVIEANPNPDLWPTCRFPTLAILIMGNFIMSHDNDELNTCALDQSPNP